MQNSSWTRFRSYLHFYFQYIHAGTGLQSGANIFPIVCLLPGSIIDSILTSKLGRFRWAITAICCGLLILLGLRTKTAAWAGIFAIFGVGHGMVLASVNVGIQTISKPEDCGRAASMYAFVRTLGMSVGVAVSSIYLWLFGGWSWLLESTTFQNIMSSHLTKLNLPVAISRESESYITTLYSLSPTDPLRVGVLEAYSHGFKAIFLVMTCVAGSSIFASAFIGKFSMNRSLESESS